uniref:Ankyrin-repeat containing protein n=1 Tax=Rhizophora mucronata TaxID=61149 RepID=A0A2P2KER0_RHIMU
MKSTNISAPHRSPPQAVQLPEHPLDIHLLHNLHSLHRHGVFAFSDGPAANGGRPCVHPSPPPFPYLPQQLHLVVGPHLDHPPARSSGDRSVRPTTTPLIPKLVVPAMALPLAIIVVANPILVIVSVIAIEVSGSSRGRRVEEGEYGVVLAEGRDGVADGGDVAAAGAREGGVGGGSEHPGETLLAEAVAAFEQQRNPLLLVVPRLAHRAARNLHFPLSLSLSPQSDAIVVLLGLESKGRKSDSQTRQIHGEKGIKF